MDGLYIHVPFCAARCDYCGFYREAGAGADVRAAWRARLARDAAGLGPRCGRLRHVYVGGGTPSVLDTGELAALFELVAEHFELAAGAEVSFEANPGSLTADKARLLAERGVTRVSLGVQSFSPAQRAAIGRRGAVAAIQPAVATVRAAGIPQLCCDLIYGAPGQSLADWRADLRQALALAPDHVSCYELMIEPGTPLARRGPRELPEDRLIAMWELAGELLGGAGLPRYEVSNYAAPGRECRHNLEVWHGARFAGLGPSASWFEGESRWANVADLRQWLAGAPPVEDRLSPEDRAVEILTCGLRTVAGWEREAFRAATGSDWEALRGPALTRLAEEGLLEYTRAHLRPTNRGLLLANVIGRELL